MAGRGELAQIGHVGKRSLEKSDPRNAKGASPSGTLRGSRPPGVIGRNTSLNGPAARATTQRSLFTSPQMRVFASCLFVIGAHISHTRMMELAQDLLVDASAGVEKNAPFTKGESRCTNTRKAVGDGTNSGCTSSS